MDFCTNCGSIIQDNSIFCDACGARIEPNSLNDKIKNNKNSFMIKNQTPQNQENEIPFKSNFKDQIEKNNQSAFLKLLEFFYICFSLDIISLALVLYINYIVYYFNPFNAYSNPGPIFAWIVAISISAIQASIYHELIDTRTFDQFFNYKRMNLGIPVLHILILAIIYIGIPTSFPISNSLVYVLEGGILVGLIYLPLRIINYRSSEPILTKLNRSENELLNYSKNDSNKDLQFQNNMLTEVINYRYR